MARPSQNLTERITIRLTSEELARLKAQADIAAVELSTLTRAQLLKAPIPRRARRRSPDHRILGEAVAALNRVGGNVNQLTKLAHRFGDLTAYKAALADRAALVAAAELVTASLAT